MSVSQALRPVLRPTLTQVLARAPWLAPAAQPRVDGYEPYEPRRDEATRRLGMAQRQLGVAVRHGAIASALVPCTLATLLAPPLCLVPGYYAARYGVSAGQACVRGAYSLAAAAMEGAGWLLERRPGADVRLCRNPETLLGDPIGEVSPTFFYRTHDFYGFDIRELAQWISAQRRWVHPYTRQPLSPTDVERFVAHPSGVGAETQRSLEAHAARASDISEPTLQRLSALAEGMRDAPSANASEMLAGDFSSYYNSLLQPEREALAQYSATFRGDDSFTAWLERAGRGGVCMHGLAGDLGGVVAAIRRNLAATPGALGDLTDRR
jgi:hypothetical protein